MTEIFNRHSDLEKRRRLRDEMPPAEMILWQHLKGRQIAGRKFRRQYGVGGYVVDFYCVEEKLVIEVDGPSHREPDANAYDKARQEHIEQLGLRVLRFTNHDVYENIETVLKLISNSI